MAAANHTLPDLDALPPGELKALILSQHEQLLSKDEQLASRDNEIEHLKLLIAKLRRMQFGRKSEKLDRQIEQLELRLDELQATPAENTSASRTPAVAAPVANAAAKPTRKPLPEHLPREVRRQAETSGRRRFGNSGVRAGAIPSGPSGSTEAGLRVLRTHRAGPSAEPSHRARHGRTGPLGARAGVEILRSLAAVSPVRNLCAGRCGARTLDAGGLGGRNEPVACAAGGSAAAARAERDQAARRRHAGTGAGAGKWKNKNRAAMDVCARRPSRGRRHAGGGVVRLFT